MEIWKEINIANNYEVSSLGNIRRKNNTYMTTYRGKIVERKIKTNLIGKKLNENGYKRINLNQKTYLVHRIVAETFISNPNNKPDINHINCIKTDNRIENLEWVTNQENRDHAVKNNLIANRSNGFCKITLDNINKIHILSKKGLTQKEIAIQYNVCQQTISRILKIKD